ncbi:hypothetical protein BDN70DRAFT_494251 [Pholiota conissans]|uniref:Uncharacterized protein n=1 Tax=Pholiota conissans TaxID=109636 RepID=A0A9P6CMX5_9AGAR|nr:hypothetical protein BDN70DRAFT_494251 [Pholiota conissans]
MIWTITELLRRSEQLLLMLRERCVIWTHGLIISMYHNFGIFCTTMIHLTYGLLAFVLLLTLLLFPHNFLHHVHLIFSTHFVSPLAFLSRFFAVFALYSYVVIGVCTYREF